MVEHNNNDNNDVGSLKRQRFLPKMIFVFKLGFLDWNLLLILESRMMNNMLKLKSQSTIDSIQRITMIMCVIIAIRFQPIRFIEAAPKWKQQMGLPANCEQDPAGVTGQEVKRKYDQCHDDHIEKWKISLDDYYTHTKKFCCFVKETYQCEYEILEQCMAGASSNITKEKSKLFDKSCNLFYLECNLYSNFWEDNWLYITIALLSAVVTTFSCFYCWRNFDKYRPIIQADKPKKIDGKVSTAAAAATTTATELKGMDWKSLKDPIVKPEIIAGKISELIKSEISDVKDYVKSELERQREALRKEMTKTTSTTDRIDQDDRKQIQTQQPVDDAQKNEAQRYLERKKFRAQMKSTLRRKKLFTSKLSEEEKQWKDEFEAEKSLKMSEKEICRMDEMEKLQQIQRKQIIKILNKIRGASTGESHTIEQLKAMYDDYVPPEIKKRYKDGMIKQLLKQGFESKSTLKKKSFDEIADLYRKCVRPTIKDVRQLIKDSGAQEYIPFKMPSLLPKDLQDIIDYD